MLKAIWSRLRLDRNKKEVHIRKAIEEDLPFIYDMHIQLAQHEHISGEYSDPRVQAGLIQQIACAVRNAPVPMPGPRNGAGADVFVITVDNLPIGFVIFLEDHPGSWNEKVEILTFAITNSHQRRGLGTLMLAQLLPALPSQVIYARCRKPSTQMKQLLEHFGFRVTSTSAAGTATLTLRR